MSVQPDPAAPAIIRARMAGRPERRWPTMAAFVTTWVCPATAARRLVRAPLWAAYLVHLSSLILTPIVVVACLLPWKPGAPHQIIKEILRLPPDQWMMVLSVIGAYFAFIEIAFLVTAVAMLSWGAEDEPVSRSFTHALRFTWLHTSHALPLAAAITLATLSYGHAWDDYYSTHDAPESTWRYIPPPTQPTGVSKTSKAWKDYEAALQTYQQQQTEMAAQYQASREEFNKRLPFWLKHGAAILGYGCFAAATWVIWALLRAVGTRRRVVPIVRPPICDVCGYNLTGATADGICPECGTAVVASLGPEARPGADWERRLEIGRIAAWQRCCLDAALRPKALGRRIRVRDFRRDHLPFLVAHLALVFVIAGAIIPTGYAIAEGKNPFIREPSLIYAAGPVTGYLTAVGLLAIAMLFASLTGLVLSLKAGRNMLPATMQIACYLGGFLVAFALSSAAVILLAIAGVKEKYLLNRFAGILGAGDGVALAVFLCIGFCLVFLAAYPVLIWRGATAAQYSNR